MNMTSTMILSSMKRNRKKIKERGKKINNRVFIIKTAIDPLASFVQSYFSTLIDP